MSVVDEKGKVFGWINAIDLFLLLVIMGTILGLVLATGLGISPLSKKVKASGPAEVTIAIRGARVMDMNVFKKYKKAFIIIRNQPYTTVDITNVKVWRRPLTFFVPSKGKPDRFENFEDNLATDVDITIRHPAEFTGDSVVLGGNKVKAGIPVELETLEYKFNGSIVEVKMPGVIE